MGQLALIFHHARFPEMIFNALELFFDELATGANPVLYVNGLRWLEKPVTT